jgi:hypothetical protein
VRKFRFTEPETRSSATRDTGHGQIAAQVRSGWDPSLVLSHANPVATWRQRVGSFGWMAMIGTVLWSGVRYACADDGVTIA